MGKHRESDLQHISPFYRIQDLKQQIETLTAQHKAAIQEQTNQLKEVKSNLEEQRKITEKEIELKEAAEAAVTESIRNIEELKAKITELEISRPNPGKTCFGIGRTSLLV